MKIFKFSAGIFFVIIGLAVIAFAPFQPNYFYTIFSVIVGIQNVYYGVTIILKNSIIFRDLS